MRLAVLCKILQQPWRRTMTLYGLCLVPFCICVWLLREASAPSVHYELFLTLAAGLQALAFVHLIWNTRDAGAEGLSVNTLLLFLFSHLTRQWILWQGLLEGIRAWVPDDGTWKLFMSLECSTTLMIAYKLHRVTHVRCRCDDSQKQTENWKVTTIILIGSLSMAFCTSSSTHWLDIAWMFAFWLDGLALLPQILYVRSSFSADETQMHFTIVTLLSGAVSLGYWCREAVLTNFYGNFNSLASLSFFVSLFLVSVIRLALCITYLDIFVRSSKSSTDLFAPRRHQSGVGSQDNFLNLLP